MQNITTRHNTNSSTTPPPCNTVDSALNILKDNSAREQGRVRIRVAANKQTEKAIKLLVENNILDGKQISLVRKNNGEELPDSTKLPDFSAVNYIIEGRSNLKALADKGFKFSGWKDYINSGNGICGGGGRGH